MTDMEKKVMVWLCAKIVAETDLYETDKEVQNLIDWVCLSEQIKENKNTIRNLTGEYKKIEPDCREGVRVQLERMKELCKERNSLYEKTERLERAQMENRKIVGMIGNMGHGGCYALCFIVVNGAWKWYD